MMERKSKKDLIKYIEDQDKALQKYKNRLHDLVESYKNVLKEKTALEESLAVLTQTNPEAGHNEDTESISEKNECSEFSEGAAVDNLNSLKSNLRTLMLEKARIENDMKTDRKRLLRENEELQNKLEENEHCWIEEKKKLEISIKELKKQIRDQQNDRDKEQQNHALMLKELQSLVADERAAKEKFEQQVENLKLAIEKLPDKRHEYERCIHELQNELKSTKDLLQAAEGEKKDLPSLLKQLQEEMNEMKDRHQEAVDREIKRANEAEDKLKALAAVSEERAASLEQRLSELSQMVGSYDKLRQQDQIAIQRLKERVAQLDQENTALARTVTGSEKSFDFSSDKDLDVQAIMEQISKLKGYLRLSSQMPKKQINMSVLAEMQKDDSNLHASCQKELIQLREELEQYKEKENMAKTEHILEAESNSEIALLKKQVINLQNELQLCKAQQKSTQDQLQKSEVNFQSCVTELMSRHKQELAAQCHEYQVRLLELELQIQKQRERSLALLEDKEKEICLLKSKIPVIRKPEKVDQHGSDNGDTSLTSESLQSYTDDDHLSDLISTSVINQKKSRQILHYTEEMSRKDVEIFNLRRSKSQAESTMRELQQVLALKDEKYQNEIDALKSKIKRFESAQKGMNMEYLKNVVLRFIKCSKRSDQSHMLNAIASVLHFTTLELEEARVYLHLY